MDEKELSQAILAMVKKLLVVTEGDLLRQFLKSEDLKELDLLKYVCYNLQAQGKLELMNNEKGEMILLDSSYTLH